ncbi:hypothetical protein WAI453_005822 [Rhynchosporium graminicola]|uniref:Related to homoserine acetyltransferase family protein n=1 Tax=Rhynchosporium graminicola TaxID=2792576 RepID=A0A1E1KK82_9HELO|nr:related to homoserine acetyltransferase family protein [Rhynchosporium commune]
MPPKPPYDPTGIQTYAIPSFKFTSGTTKDIKVSYRSFNSSSRRTVLIPTCYGGHINTTLNFTSGALKKYHVIVVAMLGNGESSSPSNDDEFPKDYSLRYPDCINAQYKLVTEHLGIKSLDAVVGFSMGGQQAYHWAAMYGTGENPFVKNAVVICGSAKTSGHNYAFLEGPISALTTSFDYDNGNYKSNGTRPIKGLRAFGRAYAAWLTSAEWYRQELWKQGYPSLQGYLHPPPGEAPFERWDAEDLLVLARMWQAGDIGMVRGDGDYEKALESISARVLVMPSQTDQYFPPEDGENEVRYLKKGVYAPIPTIWGHIAGGGANPTDVKWMDERIERFLTGET